MTQRKLDKLKEKCGLFGVYNCNDWNTAELTYYGLYALQHRGQESAGIAVNDNGRIFYHKEMGLVSEIFDHVVLGHLHGEIAVGHVRYATAEERMREDIQPLVLKYTKGHMALAHNGNLINAQQLRSKLEEQGTFFQTTTDLEVLAALLSRARIRHHSIEDALVEVMNKIKGAYSLLIMTPHKLIAARDPLGMRPLSLGKKGDSYIFASESTAFDAVGATYLRDVLPGEIIVVQDGKLRTLSNHVSTLSRMCVFEYVYFARPDSIIEGAEVYEARLEAGKILARECPAEADIVIGVPDSGLAAAQGYAKESGIPYGEGFVKNRYVGRTFIQPSQALRQEGVQIKLNPLRSQVKGKRVVMIDDSIVRGTTSKYIVSLLKEAGAKEVHVRISSPPVTHSCYFGIDTPHRKNLIAHTHSLEEIKQEIGADSIGFISLEGLLKTPVGATCGLCTACFTGEYPMEITKEEMEDGYEL
ncbi:MAG: amidophosphoribosyltransferase [Epulopiscium sp.]|nr:amidophosphoribosyltransferase [Candidatus Epulonipiscium sp.]